MCWTIQKSILRQPPFHKTKPNPTMQFGTFTSLDWNRIFSVSVHSRDMCVYNLVWSPRCSTKKHTNWKVSEFEDFATITQKKLTKQTKTDVLVCGCVFECTSFGNCARVTQNCPQVAQNRARSSCLVQIPGLQNCKSSTNLKNRYNCQKNYTIWDFSSFSSVVGNPKGVLFCSTNDGPGLTKLRLQTKQKKRPERHIGKQNAGKKIYVF